MHLMDRPAAIGSGARIVKPYVFASQGAPMRASPSSHWLEPTPNGSVPGLDWSENEMESSVAGSDAARQQVMSQAQSQRVLSLWDTLW